jgi:MoxR-like ATPase
MNIPEILSKLIGNINKALIGKEDVVKMSIVSLIAGGHILLEDVPGVGKTLLAKAIAKSVNCKFKRIQFTSDLLPSDIIGVSIYNQKTNDFEFLEGPIFSNILLADEINRGTPRTQSSLLEAMEELQVSIDGVTKQLPKPFFVIATQNPIESHGTFQLPDSQMDRFLISMSIGYPSEEAEIQMLSLHKHSSLIENLETIVNTNELLEIQKKVYEVQTTKEINAYIVKIINATRSNDKIMQGISPRGSVSLMLCSKAYALMNGRNYVIPDDIKYVAQYVLSHRLITYRSLTKKELIKLVNEVVNSIKVSQFL